MPYRYSAAKAPNNTDWLGNLPSDAICTSDFSITFGDRDTRTSGIEPLYSGTKIENQISCNPHPYNAGNFYSFPAATAGSNNVSVSSATEVPNSICPKGWRLPPNSDNKSYYKLIRDVYQIADGPSGSVDVNFLNNSAMSFVRLGGYYYTYGSLDNRGNAGYCWSSTAYSSDYSHYLSFTFGDLTPQANYSRADGFPIRCVSR